ncbi:MAG: aldo/keto reductase [Clostridia bacterium]|nr:aldo/keto reductase [Clostridia bacterium]
MIYNEFRGIKLPALGFGAMRLPTVDDDFSNIDEAAAGEMVAYAMEHGANYFDTAWGYHDGASERALGKLLAKYPRDSFYLADKFPGYDVSNLEKKEEIFEEQLRKCGTDYFDFYLFHNVCESNIDGYLDEKYDLLGYLLEQKRLGRIKHLGFSTHGAYDVMERFLAECGEHMEFCQIQLNWLDWSFQQAEAKVELLRRNSIPVWVMEPLRGGALAKLDVQDEAKLLSLRPDEGVPAWSLRFLQSVPEVIITLSGMSNMTQLAENIATYDELKPLSDAERETLFSIAKGMTGKIALPCTSCRYCTTYCPMELDIPKLIGLYNEHAFTGGGFIAPMMLSTMPEDKQPSACIGCRSCEAVCPQQIKISEGLASFAKMLS